MCFFFSLLPATIWVVLGYLVLFVSTKGEGTLRKVGQILAVWIFIIALFFPICGAYISLSGNCPMEKMMEKMEMPGGG